MELDQQADIYGTLPSRKPKAKTKERLISLTEAIVPYSPPEATAVPTSLKTAFIMLVASPTVTWMDCCMALYSIVGAIGAAAVVASFIQSTQSPASLGLTAFTGVVTVTGFPAYCRARTLASRQCRA